MTTEIETPKRGYMPRSKSDVWNTPRATFDALKKEFNFQLDAAANAENALCANYFGPGSPFSEDGLSVSWRLPVGAAYEGMNICVWCNPPYSNLSAWIEKAYNEAALGCRVVMLIPARTDTIAWHTWILNRPGVEVRFLKGRLKFSGHANSAPFPSAVVIFSS